MSHVFLGNSATTLSVPRRATFKERKDERGRWYIDLPKSMTANGKRQRYFFPNRDTAREIVKAGGLDVHGAGAALHWRNLKAFWNWYAKSPRVWCIKDLFDAVESPKTASDGDISILSPAEATSLMRTAQKHYPAAVASFALSLFAGIRAEELKRLTADDVTADGIELSSKITKRGCRRHISLSPTLAAWLKVYPF